VQSEYDAIVVGAGLGGSACALSLARKGANVLILEKAKIPGERNMSGGILFGTYPGGYGLLDLVPDFETEAPVQRRIVRHEVNVISEPDYDEGNYRYYRMEKDSVPSKLGLFKLDLDSGHDYTVLRRDFDQWFANKAVQEGAMLSTQTSVESLLIENGAVVGVRTTHEDIRSNVVIDASGVVSNLVEMAGLRPKLEPTDVYHGLKHLYKFDPAVIEQRFGLKKGEGKGQLYLGPFMKGVLGGAFLYTNNDTLSVGIVVSLASMVKAFTEHFDIVGKSLDILESFESHPMVAELLQGGELLEYSAHNVPKGYKCMLKKPYASGFMAVGDSLGSFVKIGPLLDGMRMAVMTGMMAAETYVQARDGGSFGESALSTYQSKLSPVYKDIGKSKSDSRINESPLVYEFLPKLLFSTYVMYRVKKIVVDGRKQSAKDAIQRVQAGTSLLNYDEDEEYSHIKVDTVKGSASPLKPWVVACPVNCYTLATPKGVFVSYSDLLGFNMRPLEAKYREANGFDPVSLELEAIRSIAHDATVHDVADGKLKFDHVACVACGTCGQIGPREIVAFGPERDGHGVRYRYG
jgi:electron transfer flavoprotein-quinone oxidoreductase